jgi:hypothetical protein
VEILAFIDVIIDFGAQIYSGSNLRAGATFLVIEGKREQKYVS